MGFEEDHGLHIKILIIEQWNSLASCWLTGIKDENGTENVVENDEKNSLLLMERKRDDYELRTINVGNDRNVLCLVLG